MKNIEINSEFKRERGVFLIIRENHLLFTSIRNFFGTDENFPKLTYSESFKQRNEIESVLHPYSEIFKDLVEKVVFHEKGNKSLIWINPKYGEHTGILSDTFLDLVVLANIPDELKKIIRYNGRSRYYLLKGLKIRTQTGSCEPIFNNPKSIVDNYQNKLIKPVFHYWEERGNLKSIEIDFYLPISLITHHISELGKTLDAGRRIEKEKLVEWGYLKKINRRGYEIAEKCKEMISQVQNLFFLEWWRGFFKNEAWDMEIIKKQLMKFQYCPEEIVLRAFIESLINKHPTKLEIEISKISKLISSKESTIINCIKQWIIGEGIYGKECLIDNKFIYPPVFFDRFWAKWEIIDLRYIDSLKFIDRKKELESITKFLSSNFRILSIIGDHGVGKTRFLVESAKLYQSEWDFYWLLANQKISWDEIKRQCQTNKKIILVIDDTAKIKDWELILEQFQQLEISSRFIKLIIVSAREEITDYFIQNHYVFRNEEILKNLNLKPLDFKNINTKNEIVRILLEKQIEINDIEPILDFSQGYPEVIEDEIYYRLQHCFKTHEIDELSSITRFNERTSSIWNKDLSKLEKKILKILSLIGFLNINDEPILEINKDQYDKILERLIQKNWIGTSLNTISFKRAAIMNWVLENKWIKGDQSRIKLKKLIGQFIDKNPQYFLRSAEILKNILNFTDFKEILGKVIKWGRSEDFKENLNQMLVLFKILPYIALNYFKNFKILINDPSSAKDIKDPSLIDDISSGIKDLIKRFENNWRINLNSKEFLELYHSAIILTPMLSVIQDFKAIIQVCNDLINIINTFDDNTQNKIAKIINSIFIKKLSAEIMDNPGEYKRIYKGSLNFPYLDTFHRGLIYRFWGESLLRGEERDFKKIYALFIKSSDCFAKSDYKEHFVYLWAYFSTYLHSRFGNKEIFTQLESQNLLIRIKNKLDLAAKWAKENKMVRQYIGLILNWYIFDNSGVKDLRISELKKLTNYSLKHNEFYLSADVCHQIGKEYFENEDYKNAINYFEMCIKYTKKSGVLTRLELTYSYLGDSYWRDRRFEKAIEAHNKSYNLHKKTGNTPEAMYSLNSIFDINLARGDIDSALKVSEEILFLSKQPNNSVFYIETLMRIIEVNYLKGNYGIVDQKLKEIQKYEERLDRDPKLHLELLKILNKLKLKNLENINDDLRDYFRNIKNYDFKNNDFEINWIHRLIDNLYSVDYQHYIDKFSELIKDIEFFKNRPETIYEFFLLNLDNFLKIYKKNIIEWPNSFQYFLNKFQKPNQFLYPQSRLIEIFRDLDKKNKIDSIKSIISDLNEITLNEKKFDQNKIFQLLLRLPEILLFITSNQIEDIEIVEKIYQILKDLYNQINSQDIELNNLKLDDKPFSFLNLFMKLADVAQDLGELHLCSDIIKFVQNNSLYSKSLRDKANFLKYYRNYMEIKGNKQKAAEISDQLEEILKKIGSKEEIIENRLQNLILNLSINYSKKITREIQELNEDLEEISVESKIIIKSIKIFLLIKQHNINEAKIRAQTLIFDKEINQKSQLQAWFISEFIDRIYIQEELSEIELNPKIIKKYIDLFEKDEDVKKLPLIANYERAFISIFLKMLENFRNNLKIDTSLNYCIRSLKILREHNWADFDKALNQFMGVIHENQGKLLKERKFDESIKFSEKILDLSKEINALWIEFMTLDMLINEYLFIEKYFEVSNLCFEFFNSYNRFKENLKISPDSILNNPIIKGLLERMQIDSSKIDRDKLLELISIKNIEILLFSMSNLINKVNPYQFAEIRHQLFTIIIQSLDFSILRKGNESILYSFWDYLIDTFHIFIINIFGESELNNRCRFFNNLILNLKGITEWEEHLISVWKISINLIGDNLSNKLKKFEELKDKILLEIPQKLKKKAKRSLQIIKKGIGENLKPKEISMRFNLGELKYDLKEIKQINDINQFVEVIILIVKYHYLLKEFNKCLKYINIGQEIFQENGREKELLILNYFNGLIYYSKGNFEKAKNIFEHIINFSVNLEVEVFIPSTLYYVQILINQGNVMNKVASEILEKYYDYLEKCSDISNTRFISLLFENILSVLNPISAKAFLRYFIENKIKIIDQLVLESENYKELTLTYQIGVSIINMDYENFPKTFKKYFKFDAQKCFEIILLRKLPIWIEYLSLHDREKFNEKAYPILEKILLNWKKELGLKIKINKDIYDDQTLEDPEIPEKSPYYFFFKLLQNHPEIFEITSK